MCIMTKCWKYPKILLLQNSYWRLIYLGIVFSICLNFRLLTANKTALINMNTFYRNSK